MRVTLLMTQNFNREIEKLRYPESRGHGKCSGLLPGEQVSNIHDLGQSGSSRACGNPRSMVLGSKKPIGIAIAIFITPETEDTIGNAMRRLGGLFVKSVDSSNPLDQGI